MNIAKEAQEAAAAQCCANGSIGYDNAKVAAPSLRERIAGQRQRAHIEATRAMRLEELEYLLDKHPEISRILDLLEVVRG